MSDSTTVKVAFETSGQWMTRATWEKRPEHLNILIHHDTFGDVPQRIIRVCVRYCYTPLPSDEFGFSGEAPIGRVTEIHVEPATIWRRDAKYQREKQGALVVAAIRRAVEELQSVWSDIHGRRLTVQDNTSLLSSSTADDAAAA